MTRDVAAVQREISRQETYLAGLSADLDRLQDEYDRFPTQQRLKARRDLSDRHEVASAQLRRLVDDLAAAEREETVGQIEAANARQRELMARKDQRVERIKGALRELDEAVAELQRDRIDYRADEVEKARLTARLDGTKMIGSPSYRTIGLGDEGSRLRDWVQEIGRELDRAIRSEI